MSRTAQEYHELAEELAEKGRGAVDALLDAVGKPDTMGLAEATLSAQVATACAALSEAYSALAWSPGLAAFDAQDVIP